MDPEGREVLQGNCTGRMYMTARLQTRLIIMDIWHRYFGYTSVKVICKVLVKNLADGLDIKGNLSIPRLCEDCVYEKHTYPYYVVVKPEGSPNNKVHIDLWGQVSA